MATKSEELTAIIQEIRDRVRRSHPSGQAGSLNVPLPDLLPILHAKDAAEAKAAAIGSVNPRPPGLVNSAIQKAKTTISRSLNWFVRDQVEFNRSMLQVVEALLTALNEQNRVTIALAQSLDKGLDEARQQVEHITRDSELRVQKALAESEKLRLEASLLGDIRTHWYSWRVEWEQKLAQNEAILLRAVAELQTAHNHRLALLESGFRESVREQHTNFRAALDEKAHELQQQVWEGLAELRKLHHELRVEHERTIRTEIRMARPGTIAVATTANNEHLPIDYRRFAERFRGSEDYVLERARFYVPLFRDHAPVLDIGCGRGEFLSLLRDEGVQARGIDLDVEQARAKGLDVVQGDMFQHLESLEESSLGGIFCSQVIEHLEPASIPQLIALAARKTKPGGILALETPDPASLAIFATHFYIDPTHTRPVPAPLAVFYLEEAGFGAIDVHKLAPAIETNPSLAELPQAFRDAFFGGLDYAVVGYRL
ncbi:MAG TPA: class I SAM-dependent methyltransferase [Bryobacteraceae bacterium]|nr:class I SAM-dependent methyltransferase [Bryobacteraceae bacterium]